MNHRGLATIAEASARMSGSAQSVRHRKAKVFLCAVLALLFLYNPFVALPSSSTLSIQHNPSYPATIASSELQNFSPSDSREFLPSPSFSFLLGFCSPLLPVSDVWNNPIPASPRAGWYLPVCGLDRLRRFNPYYRPVISLSLADFCDWRQKQYRDVRNAWLDSRRAFERLFITRDLRAQANLSLSLSLAKSRYHLGLSSIVEFTQAELQKTEPDIEDTDAKYQYRLTQIVLAFTMSAPK
jgi:hypothetical protein